MKSRRLSILAAIGGFLLTLTVAPVTVLGASSRVECGQLSGYTAPDAAGPTDGSLQIGTLPAWDVLADATIGPVAGSTLPSIVNSGPSCLALDFDDSERITGLEVAAQGSITGLVGFDSGSGFYLFDDRLIIPSDVTDAYPGLAALFATSHQAGTPLAVTFDIDPASGQFVGFDGHAAFCGKGYLASGGVGRVGKATVPAAVLDVADRAALRNARTRHTCATVHSVGTIVPNGGPISITTDVRIDVDAAAAGPVVNVTIPPTDVEGPVRAATPSADLGGAAPWILLTIVAAAAVLVHRARSATRTRRPVRPVS